MDSRHVVRHHDGLGNVAGRDVSAQKLGSHFRRRRSQLFDINFSVSLAVTSGHFTLREKRKRTEVNKGAGRGSTPESRRQ